MKNDFKYTPAPCHNGFVFPFVLLLSLLLLGVTTTSIQLYQNHQYITQLHLDNIVMDTLFQCGIAKFHKEMSSLEELPKSGEVMYLFPDGEASINYTWIEGRTYDLQLVITTNKGVKNKFGRVYKLEEA
ncbi:hypothetical protein [Thalassobacillus devorans]|uniref:hypothetical protein n=1 Tax=Thalassobacillus devorans TaxID=279813 RepID=UPI0004908E42|nr:hypothetical protein [Thalassobacillus devorans]